jgi:hypothetical protein
MNTHHPSKPLPLSAFAPSCEYCNEATECRYYAIYNPRILYYLCAPCLAVVRLRRDSSVRVAKHDTIPKKNEH